MNEKKLTFSVEILQHFILAALLAKYFTEIRVLEIFGSVILWISSFVCGLFTLLLLGTLVVMGLYVFTDKLHAKNNVNLKKTKSNIPYMIFTYLEATAILYFSWIQHWYVISAMMGIFLFFAILMLFFRKKMHRKLAKDMLLNFRAESQ